ncbi:MAG: hypothetical protein ACMG6H_17030, partial [Acidobacteriota bacterium]
MGTTYCFTVLLVAFFPAALAAFFAGFSDCILRDGVPDLVAFTVIVHGARGFAFLVAILILVFIDVFGLIEPRNVRGI